MDGIETVSFELIKKIYLHINRTEKQAVLLTNRQKWDRLTSALNVLEDTSWAIEYYLENDYPIDFKGKYLYTYGLLQALFVQEDAINSISVALFAKEIDFKNDYPKAYAVRELRNDVVGHPTCRSKTQFIYLAQCSLSKNAFYYSKDNSNTGKSEIVDVDVSAAINDQACCINTILKNAVSELDAEFRQYIEQHRGRKMKEIFSGLHYAKEKTLNPNHLGPWGYSSTKDMVKKCEEELALRYGSVDVVDSYKYLLEDIHEIYSLIDNGVPQIPYDLQNQFEKYMMQLLFTKLEELESYCEETDSYFENYGKECVIPESASQVTIIFGEEGFDEPEE